MPQIRATQQITATMMPIMSPVGILSRKTRRSIDPVRKSTTIKPAVAAYIGLGLSGESLNPPSSVAPTAPTDAASVGVAMPARMEPSTEMINTMGAIRAWDTLIASSLLVRPSISSSRGMGGEVSGRTMAIKI